MSLKSMTGFAREAGATGSHVWAWELKTVNGRGLEVRTRVPGGFEAVAEEARRQITASMARGQCQLGLSLSRSAQPASVRVNRAALAALIESLRDVSLPATVRPASLDGLLSVRGIVEIDDDATDPDADAALRQDVVAALPRLVEAAQASRGNEGAALLLAIGRQLGEIERLVAAAEACPARKPEAIRAKIATQVATLLEASRTLDPDRLHQEAALLASRADIQEELDRLRAHVSAARELLATTAPAGRRLDFLAQEFGREANTLCAKANDVALSRIGLDLKAVVEQFREQVANVE